MATIRTPAKRKSVGTAGIENSAKKLMQQVNTRSHDVDHDYIVSQLEQCKDLVKPMATMLRDGSLQAILASGGVVNQGRLLPINAKKWKIVRGNYARDLLTILDAEYAALLAEWCAAHPTEYTSDLEHEILLWALDIDDDAPLPTQVENFRRIPVLGDIIKTLYISKGSPLTPLRVANTPVDFGFFKHMSGNTFCVAQSPHLTFEVLTPEDFENDWLLKLRHSPNCKVRFDDDTVKPLMSAFIKQYPAEVLDLPTLHVDWDSIVPTIARTPAGPATSSSPPAPPAGGGGSVALHAAEAAA